jgi:hypothetical protein
MKRLWLGVVLLFPVMMLGQSAFNGTWVINPQSGQFSGKPFTFSLQNGTYRCDSCVPAIEIKADGKDHKRTGSPYSDAISARAVDDNTIEVTSKKDGKVVGTSKDTVSADGKSLTSEWTFSANGQEGHGKTVFARTAPASSGAHKASGSWQQEKFEDASSNITKVTFQASDDGLNMSDPLGDSYSAKFDGKDYPYKGDPGTTSVSLKKIDANTIEETDKRDGKVISVSRLSVSPDGQTMTIESNDTLHGTTSKYEAKKQ